MVDELQEFYYSLNINPAEIFYFAEPLDFLILQKTICALSNEPNLGGGTVLIGIDPIYNLKIIGLENPNDLIYKIQEICRLNFNLPLIPIITLHLINQKYVIYLRINEIPKDCKPVKIKVEDYPNGVYRRLGKQIYSCFWDDIYFFKTNFTKIHSYLIEPSSMNDIQIKPLKLFKKLLEQNSDLPISKEISENWMLEVGLGNYYHDKFRLNILGILFLGHNNLIKQFFPNYCYQVISNTENYKILNNFEQKTIIPIFANYFEYDQKIWSVFRKFLPFLKFPIKELSKVQYLYKTLINFLVKFSFVERNYFINERVTIVINKSLISWKIPGIITHLAEDGLCFDKKFNNPELFILLKKLGLFYSFKEEFSLIKAEFENYNIEPISISYNYKENYTCFYISVPFSVPKAILSITKDFNNLTKQKYFSPEKSLNFILNNNHNIHYRNWNILQIFRLNNYNNFYFNSATKIIFYNNFETVLENGEFTEWQSKKKEIISAISDYTESIYVTEKKNNINQSWEIKKLNNNYLKCKENKIKHNPTELKKQFNLTNFLDSRVISKLNEGEKPKIIKSLEPLPIKIQVLVHLSGQKSKEPEFLKKIILKICRWKPQSLENLAYYIKRHPKYLLINYIKPLRQQGLLEFTRTKKSNHPKQKYKTLRMK